MEKPQINEYWTIEYGLKVKTRHIVQVIEERELTFPNWRKHHFKCKHDDGSEVFVDGECFIVKWD